MLKIIRHHVGKFMVNVIRQKFNLMFKYKTNQKKSHQVTRGLVLFGVHKVGVGFVEDDQRL